MSLRLGFKNLLSFASHKSRVNQQLASGIFFKSIVNAADARCVTGMRFQDYQRSHACRLSFASWRWNKENTTEIWIVNAHKPVANTHLIEEITKRFEQLMMSRHGGAINIGCDRTSAPWLTAVSNEMIEDLTAVQP